MGRTDTKESNRIKSPVQRYVKFSGELGAFSYWDAEAKKSVALEQLDFIVLETRASIGGWSDDQNAAIFSKYFKSTKDIVSIRCGDKDLMAGSFAENKDKIKALGGKYQQNVFALADINGTWELVAIQFTGAALMAWSTFVDETKMFNVYKSLVVGTQGAQSKKGRVLFYAPAFATEACTPDLMTKADEVYENELKPFLDQE
jgi:hypothetical protein